MTASLILSTPQAMTAPLPGTPKLMLVGDKTKLTTDDFTGGDALTIGGRVTDAAQGGTPMTWGSTLANSMAITNGELVSGTATSGAYFNYLNPTTAVDSVLFEFTLNALTVGSTSLYIDLFREATTSSTGKKMRVYHSPTGTFTWYYADGAASTIVSGSAVTFAVGDRVGLEFNNKTGKFQTYKNGAAQLAAGGMQSPQFNMPGRMFGFAGSAGVQTNYRIDALSLTAITV